MSSTASSKSKKASDATAPEKIARKADKPQQASANHPPKPLYEEKGRSLTKEASSKAHPKTYTKDQYKAKIDEIQSLASRAAALEKEDVI